MKAFVYSACAALLLAMATPAAAKSVKIEASGVVSSGSDATGAFGGGNMAGLAFSFSATFDLSRALYVDLGSRTDFVGGESYDYLPGPTPLSMGNGVITVKGIDRLIEANWNTTLTAFAGGFDQQSLQQRNQIGADLFVQGIVFTEQPGYGLFGPDYTPPSGNLCGAGHTCNSGNFSIEQYVSGSLFAQTFLQLDTASLTITEVQDPVAVPEPSAWALMIGGFSLTGAVLRSRRRTLVA